MALPHRSYILLIDKCREGRLVRSALHVCQVQLTVEYISIRSMMGKHWSNVFTVITISERSIIDIIKEIRYYREI